MYQQLEKIKARIKFNKKQQQAFLENLASLINDGVNIKEAAETLESISTGSNKQVAAAINSSLAQGQGIANGLSHWFPTAIVEIIRAGENSGTLNNAIQSAADSLKQQTNLISSTISNITYPIIVFSLSLIMLVVIKKTVLENFASIKPLSLWPSNGIALYHFAEFIEYWWWTVLCVIVLLGILIYKFLTTFTGESRYKLDKIPLLNLYRDTTAARFMRTLGLLISNGIIVKKALNIMSYEAQPYLAWHIINMEYRLSGGIDNIADVLDTKLLSDQDLLRLKVVSKGKGFAPALISLGEQAQKRTQQLAILVGRIVGACILISGAIIAANIIFGIYSVGSALTR